MTVKELINQLNRYPSDSEVCIQVIPEYTYVYCEECDTENVVERETLTATYFEVNRDGRYHVVIRVEESHV